MRFLIPVAALALVVCLAIGTPPVRPPPPTAPAPTVQDPFDALVESRARCLAAIPGFSVGPLHQLWIGIDDGIPEAPAGFSDALWRYERNVLGHVPAHPPAAAGNDDRAAWDPFLDRLPEWTPWATREANRLVEAIGAGRARKNEWGHFTEELRGFAGACRALSRKVGGVPPNLGPEPVALSAEHPLHSGARVGRAEAAIRGATEALRQADPADRPREQLEVARLLRDARRLWRADYDEVRADTGESGRVGEALARCSPHYWFTFGREFVALCRGGDRASARAWVDEFGREVAAVLRKSPKTAQSVGGPLDAELDALRAMADRAPDLPTERFEARFRKLYDRVRVAERDG